MKHLKYLIIVLALVAFVSNDSLLLRAAQNEPQPTYPPVTAPPESFFELVRDRDREEARKFYKKCIDVKGMPVVASGEVADQALQRTYWLVTHMLAGRPDILQAMVSNGMYLIIIGKDQVYTDMPENRNAANPAYLNERVRGTGGKPTSFGEENLLCMPIDRYDDESIGHHEFCHTIDGTLRSIDPTWSDRKNAVHRNAMNKGLWKNTYAASNAGEYWAEVCQSYFDNNRMNNWNHGPIGTREQLKEYDPEAYELVKATFNLDASNDWRYSWLHKQPSVFPPPARFKIDPYYTKFTWAREFPVVGRQASDDAMLKANDTIRKMFAYRHDILKALISEDIKLVVLGRSEKLSDLPEYPKMRSIKNFKASSRMLDYSPETKVIVLGEEIILGNDEPKNSECALMGQFAKALYQVTCLRPVDPNWNNRGRSVQQYELRVKRLDIQFDEKLQQVHQQAVSKALWKGTPASSDRVDYWAKGVMAYFDACGQPVGSMPGTREKLQTYDPELYALVHETMAYEGRHDWRYASK